MWMLLIVKLLSFKRYNYPFYKCRENRRQMQCAYSQCLNDKVVPLLFSLYCKIQETNAMHCFSASSVSCVTERLSGCKDTDLYWIRANYYLKKYYSTVAFSIILIAPLHVSQSMSCRQWAMWTWFHNLKADKIRKRISHYFGLQPIVLESWITSLTLLRNAFCHHSRV